MKNFLTIGFILINSISLLFAQDSNAEKKYATLGQDDQSLAADEDGLVEGEVAPSLRVVPFQWVDLREPSKEAKVFQPEAVAAFLANSTDEAVDQVEMGMSMDYFGEKITSLNIVINGYVALGQQNLGTLVGANSYSPSGIPSARLPNNVVAPLWVDIDFANGSGYVYYRTFKPENNDKSFDHMIIQWDEAGLYSDYDTSDGRVTLTFQIVLFAAGGVMFQYKTISAETLRKQLEEDQGFGFQLDIDLETANDYDLIKALLSYMSTGYENKDGLKGISWDATITSGMSLANELVPDWASGSGGDNFLNILDGRDRRNNAVTSSGSGCFIAKKKASSDR